MGVPMGSGKGGKSLSGSGKLVPSGGKTDHGMGDM